MKCAWNSLLSLLPAWLRPEVDRQQEHLQELRLRIQRVTLVTDGKRLQLPKGATQEDLRYVVNSACRYSPWRSATMQQGYLATEGGHRIGLCGEVTLREGQIAGISRLTSINIRVARDFPGISRDLCRFGGSVLILGPPGSGKTTLLRDLIRQRSGQETISVVDSRGELFPAAAAFPEGEQTDILTNCPKSQGLEMVLRTMNPDCIAVDEITAAEDCNALLHAGWCGVKLLATAHAASVEDLKSRPVYAPLAQCGLFDTAVILRRDKSWRVERMGKW